MLIMMFMLMMLMMMKLEQVPTFLHCEGNGWIIRRVEDKIFLLNVSRLQSTACRLLFDSVSRTNLSTECLNAEPFKRGPECLPCFESSNVLLDEVLPKGCGHP